MTGSADDQTDDLTAVRLPTHVTWPQTDNDSRPNDSRPVASPRPGPGRVDGGRAVRGRHEHMRTARLRLDAVTGADQSSVAALHADPAVRALLPSGRHLDRHTTTAFVAVSERGWQRDGLGYWAVRVPQDLPRGAGGHPAGTFVGVGGCTRRFGVVWNLHYRLIPAAWGCGFAAEIAAAARWAAAHTDPTLPVVAHLLEANLPSRRTAEQAGLTLAWSGPDRNGPDPAAVRLLYADRPLAGDVLTQLTTQPESVRCRRSPCGERST